MDRLLPGHQNAGWAPVRFAARLMQAIYRGLERSRQRRALSGLNDAMLRDLGLSRADVAREVEKPFWR
jgi:uncharacterized protein YjiS (DUF1127 family)